VAEGTPRDLKRQVSGDSVLLSLHDEDGALARARLLIAAEPYVRELTTDVIRSASTSKMAAPRCPGCCDSSIVSESR